MNICIRSGLDIYISTDVYMFSCICRHIFTYVLLLAHISSFSCNVSCGKETERGFRVSVLLKYRCRIQVRGFESYRGRGGGGGALKWLGCGIEGCKRKD